jgi:YggT family protein
MMPLLWLVDQILSIYMWLLIVSVVLSWLVAFDIIQVRHPFVRSVMEFLYRITDPVLRPIRNLLPNLGGIDISPVIAILLIQFLRMELAHLAGYL